MQKTGLEDFLHSFNVDATGEHILTYGLFTDQGLVVDISPQLVLVKPLQEAVDARQRLAQTFKDEPLQWWECRRINTLANTAANPGATNYNAQVIMGSLGIVWTETDMEKQPTLEKRKLLTNPTEAKKRVTRDPLPVMVAVTESSADPHGGSQGQKPRLLVIGTSSIVTNRNLRDQGGATDLNLILSSINWCRERYANIGVQPKTHTSYVMPKVSYARLFWLPTFGMMLGIFGFGMIIWNMETLVGRAEFRRTPKRCGDAKSKLSSGSSHEFPHHLLAVRRRGGAAGRVSAYAHLRHQR